MLNEWRARALQALPALGLTGLALMAALSLAEATTLRRMSLPDLVKKADRVVHARAMDQKVYWDESGTRIFTDTTFEIIDEAKGHGPDRLTVIMVGGRIDPVEMSAEGTPQFSLGEEVVLFTTSRPDNKKNLAGYTQGVLRIATDPASGVKFAVSEVPLDVTYVDKVSGKLVRVRPERLRAPLGALMDQVRQIDRGEAPAGPRINKTAVRVDQTPGRDGSRP